MQPGIEQGLEYGVYRPVASDAAHPREFRAGDFHGEMALPAFAGTGMAGMFGGIVDHLEGGRGEFGFKT